MSRGSIWDSALHYFHSRKPMPSSVLERDVSLQWQADSDVQQVLLEIHRNDPEAAMVAEAMVDLDEGLQEWRYRHVKIAERTIGNKRGTGGSLGVEFLKRSLFQPIFPDLWAIRHEM